MVDAAAALPFLFRELLPSRRVLLTNMLGSYTLLQSREQLNDLASGNLSGLPAELIEDLFAKSFLCEAGELDLRASLLASGLTTSMSRALARPGLFMVVPTLRCDHDCRYCQVSRAPLHARDVDASLENIPAILNCIKSAMGRTAKIEFQGGEPLLRFEYIREFIAQAMGTLEGKDVTYVICSALGPLHGDVVDWAKKHPVTFSISLDGDSPTHNTNRPSRYFDAYANTLSKLTKLREELGRDRVSCVATVTRETLARPVELVDAYFDAGLDSLFVRPLAPFGFAAKRTGIGGYSAQEYAAFLARVLRRVIEMNTERPFVEEATLLRLRRIYDPGFSGSVDMQSPAGFLLGALVFNYDGRVFGSDEARMLWESTKAPELVLGTVSDGIAAVATNTHAARMLTDTFTCVMPGCEDCAYQPFCGADPMHHLATQGDHVGDKAISFFCQLQRAQLDQLFQLLDEPHARRVLESWLRR